MSVLDVLHGLVDGIQGIASLAFVLSFTFFSLFFLLKDGRTAPRVRRSPPRRPAPVARTITNDMVESIRHYFIGVTIVAAFNGIVVGLGALLLGVPLAGTIAVVTFVTAYIPFIGAFIAGAFAVVLALGSQGVTVALIMLVIVILANGLLQNIVQPIAFGATLNLHPLVVLVVDDRRRRPVRHGRPHPRRAAHLGRRPHRPGAGRGPDGRSRAGGRASFRMSGASISPVLDDAEPPAIRDRGRMRRLLRNLPTVPLAILGSALMLAAAGCGGSSSDTKANEAYANSVCTAIGGWTTQVKSIASDMSGGVSKATLQAKLTQVETATTEP